MTPAGTPPTPIETRRKRGTLRTDRMPPVQRTGLAPLDLAAARAMSAVEAFDQALEAEPSWLAESDIPTVSLCRELLVYLEELAPDPEAKPSQVASLFQRSQQVLADLGLSPAGRRKLGVGARVAAVPRSKLESLRAEVRGDE